MRRRRRSFLKRLQATSGWRVVADAVGHFTRDDAMALSSHIALSGIIAFFPFLIFLTSLAGFFGSDELAISITTDALNTLPETIAAPIAEEVRKIITVSRPGILTVSALVALWIASSGVEAVRTAFNRAYRLQDRRNFILLRLQSLAIVLVFALGLLTLATLILFAPLAWKVARALYPPVGEFAISFNLIRYSVAGSVLIVALVIAHRLLPARRPRLNAIWPGILLTLFLWMLMTSAFGFYLARFADYSATYAGLAGIMALLIFLNLTAAIMIFGAEVNVALMRVRAAEKRKAQARAAAETSDHDTDDDHPAILDPDEDTQMMFNLDRP